MAQGLFHNINAVNSEPVKKLWVFGYGSLVWNPGFKYTNSVIGNVRGYVRRFWQGNMVQRGTPEQPGRVVTLIDEPEGMTWGRAFELADEDVASTFSYLDNREAKLGGYKTVLIDFYPQRQQDADDDDDDSATQPTPTKPFPVLVYLATEASDCFLGPAPVRDLANQILAAKGSSGYNVEYVIRLADFMRQALPEEPDEHLYLLEDNLRSRIKERCMCFATLMGPNYVEPLRRSSFDKEKQDGHRDLNADQQVALNEENGNAERHREDSNTFLYTARVQPTKLRCLNV